MTNIDDYATLCQEVFGRDFPAIPDAWTQSNNVLSAMALHQESAFKTNFTKRLRRLNTAFDVRHPSRGALLEQVKQVAKNWEGACAELAVFDYLTSWEIPATEVHLNQDVAAARTYVRQLGKNGDANLDVYIRLFDTYGDVKCLKDNNAEILDGVIEESIKGLPVPATVNITPEYSIDNDSDEIQSRRSQLVDELHGTIKDALTSELIRRPRAAQSAIVSNLRYKFLWDAGVTLATFANDPYRRALQRYPLVFRHANKFVKDRPTILFFVSFPLAGGMTIEFNKFNTNYYRALARRVFCGFKHDPTTFGSRFGNMSGSETAFAVSQSLAGIVFIEDDVITSAKSDDTAIKAYWYLNPNAACPVSSVFMDLIVRGGPCVEEIDDFRYDNY